MNNGFYLSIYSHIDLLAAQTNVGVRHDQNMALWKLKDSKLELIRFWEFERLTGMKHHSMSFPSVEHAIDFINEQLSELNLNSSDLQAIIGTPGLGETPNTQQPDPELAYHNICHLYSGALLNSKLFNNGSILALALDGGPDTVLDSECRAKQYYTGAWISEGKMDTFTVPSPAVLWAFMRQHLSMAEGSLMALGSAATTKYQGPVPPSPKLKTVSDVPQVSMWFGDLVEEIWALDLSKDNSHIKYLDSRFSDEENRISMLAKVIQQESITIVAETIQEIIRQFNIQPEQTWLSITGGYALNCPSNSALMKKFGFCGFIAPPCVNDSGMSLGIGLHYFRHQLGPFHFRLAGSALGPEDTHFQATMESEEFSLHIKNVSLASPAILTNDLIQGPIAWFEGGSEIGPRALGQRSLLSDPRTIDSRNTLNQIKKREWWRPVAPIILAEQSREWFDLDYPSPYMLHTFNVKKEKRPYVPGICHLDASARVQTLEKQDNPRLYELITEFAQQTGVPIICNTSLNDKGEPVVQTAAEALNFALRKNIRVICINGLRVELTRHSEYQHREPMPRPAYKWFVPPANAEAPALSRRESMVYFHNPRLHRFNRNSPESLAKLKQLIARIDQRFGERADFRFIDIWHVQEHAQIGISREITDV
ncbi:carbamoyltransferase C-terminal domain-containing protein [Amphritea pacifica]|uniref:carbamoyltransferase C-terminal domain-containing protein n=1 Tax=Amphritea pacifica TaxID=2811233 RepID=UPI00196670F7|nr:carbamoyltransferase C-terminal domain-containing protein [Amphritea pacifica]MBN1008013.1 hypothetical protein [Amphritea pacifica]